METIASYWNQICMCLHFSMSVRVKKFKFVCFSNGKFEIFPQEKLITFVKQDVNYKIICSNIKLQQNLQEADTIYARKSVRFIEMSVLQRFFLRQFDRKAKQSVPRHTVRLMEVSSSQCVPLQRFHCIQIISQRIQSVT